MDIKFSKDSSGSQQGAADNKGKQNALLVLLLVLVGGFAYLYFFTGLIKPLPDQKPAEVPPAAQVEKKPLPGADGTAAKPDAGAGEVKKDAAAPAAKPDPAPAAAPAASPAPVAAAKPAAQEAAKASDETLSTVKKPLPTAGKAAEKKPAPVEKKEPVAAAAKPAPVAKKEPAPAAVAEKKPADVKKPVEKKAVTAGTDEKVKKAVQKPVKKEAVAPVKLAGSGNWTVLVGNYVLEEALATDLARVRKAGLEANVVPGARKKTHMNRLLLAEFTDRESALAELAKLKRSTSDAFMVDNAGMHIVYAGSYLLDTRAASEKERLAAGGFKLTQQRVDVSIPTKNLTVGNFADKSAADETLKKLRAAGVKATLSR